MLRTLLVASIVATTSGCGELGSALDMRVSPLANTSPSLSSPSVSSGGKGSSFCSGKDKTACGVLTLLIGVGVTAAGVGLEEQPNVEDAGLVIAMGTLFDVGGVVMIVMSGMR